MPYSIQYDTINKIIVGVFSGVVEVKTLKQYSIDCKNIYTENQCKLSLSDYREAFFSISVVDIYRLPQKHNNLLNSVGLNVFLFKRAAIFNQESSELAHFFEDVAVNRGQKFKAFNEQPEAIEWLLVEK